MRQTSWWVSLAREVWCIVAGHQWKSSWRRVRETEPPGWYSGKSGNPFYEYVSSWHHRCRRCRRRTMDTAWYPLWRSLWWGVAAGVRTIAIQWECYAPFGAGTRQVEGRAFHRARWPNVGWLVLAAPFTFAAQVALYLHDYSWMPLTVVGLLADADYWFMGRCERNTTYFHWLPPDGAEHGILGPDGFREVGLWQRSDLIDHDPLKRTRTHVYVGDVAKTGPVTGGSGTVVQVYRWLAAP